MKKLLHFIAAPIFLLGIFTAGLFLYDFIDDLKYNLEVYHKEQLNRGKINKNYTNLKIESEKP